MRMYESDDDPERRRDKFARERGGRDDDRRSGNFSSRDYNGPQKRGLRRDDYGGKRSRPDDDPYEQKPNGDGEDSSSAVVGPMLSFKKFLASQDDDISDEDAVKKYNDYKVEHKRQQLERFFRTHKDEEWFRQKYNPEDVKKIKDAQLAALTKRLEIFDEFKASGKFDDLSLDYKNSEKIIRILDAVVAKLEGGSEEELAAVLSQKVEDESVAELKKEKGEEHVNGNGTESAAVPEEAGNVEGEEEGAIEDDNADKASTKVNIHKTCSVFLRNIPPSITHEELEALCKRSHGFLRLAMSEPIPERRFHRRGWVTFKRDVNIKEICWNLNAVRIRDTDLNAIMNRDITRRIRTTNGITAHKQVASNDLKLAVKLVSLFDKRAGLFNSSTETEEEREKDIRMGVDLVAASTNPLLSEIRQTVQGNIEEMSSEEEELLGLANQSAKNGNYDEKSTFARDDELLNALDLLVLYLRIVHSVDFYNHGIYANEDNMPNRCGLLHVRGHQTSPTQFGADDEGNTLLSNKFVQDFIAGFNQRLEKGLIERTYVSEEEQEKLGKKDGEKEVEAFIQKNSVELAKEKWLCPLSGKKFKGPEFIRKHLQSKHEDKLSEARNEALFYNNYIADANRPMDQEQKPVSAPPREREREPLSQPSWGGRDRERDDDRGDRFSKRGSGYSRGPSNRNFGSYGRDGGRPSGGRYFEEPRRDNRPQISYRDLDAPEDIP